MTDLTHMDRRVAKTRRALQHAFMSLILEKGYDAVSIQDICDTADVGRSTFYSHHTGKEDLKRAGLDHLRRALDAAPLDGNDDEKPLAFVPALFGHAQGHARLYRALLGSAGGGVAIETVRDILKTAVAADARLTQAVPPQDLAVVRACSLGALMSGLIWWLDEGAPGDARSVAERVRQVVLHGAI